LREETGPSETACVMPSEPARVLVIDDDEVVLVAVSDLLEEQSYRVYTQSSPIGATQVIVRENIDIAVIDVNLPEMQGDSVVRLFQTWDRLKDLPVVMISGDPSARLEQIQREIPSIRIVRKAAMNRDLVPTLGELLAATRSARGPRSLPGAARTVEESSAEVAKRSRDVLQPFLDELADAMWLARSVWVEITRYELARVPILVKSLEALQHRAQLLNLGAVSDLLRAQFEIVALMKPGVEAPPRTQKAIADAVALLTSLKASRTGDFVTSPTFLIHDLRGVAHELRDASR
jgi:CheY-like chemotaxis protein